jgi:hypothetical protein
MRNPEILSSKKLGKRYDIHLRVAFASETFFSKIFGINVAAKDDVAVPVLSKRFAVVVNEEFVLKHVSFEKTKDFFEHTIHRLVDLSSRKRDARYSELAKQIINQGDIVLGVNAPIDFDSEQWHDRQMALVEPQYAGAEPSQTASFK